MNSDHELVARVEGSATSVDPSSYRIQSDQLRHEPRVVSGFRPLSEPHIGFYFGAVQQVINEQNRHPGGVYCFIADWHATTMWPGRPNMQNAIVTMAATLLALGVDPGKAFLFTQSQIVGLGEMAWLLSRMTPESILLRNPVLKRSSETNFSIGTMLYPILMSADVLALRGTKLAVGRDQTINGRKVRQIARNANRVLKYPLLPIPIVLHGVAKLTIPGIDGTKMDSERGNHVPMFASFSLLRERVQQIQTDSRGLRDAKDPDSCTVFRLYSVVASTDRVQEMRDRYLTGSIGYQDAKRELAIAIAERFSLATERFHEWIKHPDDIHDLLRRGADLASQEVSATLALLKERLGLAF